MKDTVGKASYLGKMSWAEAHSEVNGADLSTRSRSEQEHQLWRLLKPSKRLFYSEKGWETGRADTVTQLYEYITRVNLATVYRIE